MTSSAATVTTPRAHDDTILLRLAQVSVAVLVPALVVLSVVMMFFTVTPEGAFEHSADYWLTAPGPFVTLAGVGLALAVHRLQHGADGRLGRVGVWVNTLALTELFAQLVASLVQGAEVRWGPAYPLCTLLTFVGLALLAAGSWRTGLLPRWMLGVWPLMWLLGSLASQGPTPLLLAAFLVGLGLTLTRQVRGRVA